MNGFAHARNQHIGLTTLHGIIWSPGTSKLAKGEDEALTRLLLGYKGYSKTEMVSTTIFITFRPLILLQKRILGALATTQDDWDQFCEKDADIDNDRDIDSRLKARDLVNECLGYFDSC